MNDADGKQKEGKLLKPLNLHDYKNSMRCARNVVSSIHRRYYGGNQDWCLNGRKEGKKNHSECCSSEREGTDGLKVLNTTWLLEPRKMHSWQKTLGTQRPWSLPKSVGEKGTTGSSFWDRNGLINEKRESAQALNLGKYQHLQENVGTRFHQNRKRCSFSF